jgi:hypothetical protein
MKIEALVQSYESKKQEERLEEEVKLKETTEKALEVFLDKARQNLGEIYDEVSPGEAKAVYGKVSHLMYGLNIYIPITLRGVKGEIRQSYIMHNAGKHEWDTMRITFDGTGADMVLPASERDAAHFFSRILRIAADRETEKEKKNKQLLEAHLDFSRLNEIGVENQLRTAIELFPDHEPDFRQAADAQRVILAAAAEKKLISQLAQELENSERDQLQILANYAWDRPFHLFKVTYGARMDDDGEVHTSHIYTLNEMPLQNGYWNAFADGALKRWIRPSHVISIEQVTVIGEEDAPYEIKRYINLQSKNLSDVSKSVYLPAKELFAFDYDQVVVAVEAEQAQESEIADASQEDIS